MDSLIHFGIKCNACGKFPIAGIRYKCIQCNSYNLCEECEIKCGKNHGHSLLQLRNNKQIKMIDNNKHKLKEKNIKLKTISMQRPMCKCLNYSKTIKTINNNNCINIPVQLINNGNCNWPLPCFFICEESLSKIKGNRVKIYSIKGEPGEKVEFNIKLDLSKINKTGNYSSVWSLRDENNVQIGQNIIFFVNDIFKDKLRLKPLYNTKKITTNILGSKQDKTFDWLI